MNSFTLKVYQQQVLDSIEAYFKACHELPSPSIAFTATTERLWGRGNPYNPLSGFPADLPYFVAPEIFIRAPVARATCLA
jgi:type III restriction enzyme